MLHPIRAIALCASAAAWASTCHGQTFAYVPNGSSNTVSGYNVNLTSGALSPVPGSPFPTGNQPFGAAITPSQKFVYVSNYACASGCSTPSTLSGYSINPATGALTAVPGSPFLAGIGPHSIAISPSGLYLYVTNVASSNIFAFSIDAATGSLSPLTGSPFPTGSAPVGFVIDPSGRFMYVSNSGSSNLSGFAINAETGALTPVAGSPFPAGSYPFRLAISPSGRFLYVPNANSGNLSAYAINNTTGALVPIIGSPFATGGGPQAVAVDPAERYAYVGNGYGDNVSAYVINNSTGALTPLTGSPFPAGTYPYHATVSTSGEFLYIANARSNNISGYRISAATGALTPLSGSPFATTPYPASVVLTGATGLAITKVTPAKGGNAGSVTAQIIGTGFRQGAIVKLTGIGPEIIGANTDILNANFITTTFNLAGHAPGVRTLTITNPDSLSVSLPNAFTVETGGAPDLHITRTGTSPVPGRIVDYFVVVENKGNIDDPEVEITELLDRDKIELVDVNPPADADLPTLKQDSGIEWTIPSIAPGETKILSYRAKLLPQTPIGTDILTPSCGKLARDQYAQCLYVAALGTQVECSAAIASCAAAAKRCAGAPGPFSCLWALGSCTFGAYRCKSYNVEVLDVCATQYAKACSIEPERIVAPVDPNEKLSSHPRYIRPDQMITYPIHYENIGTAEARDIFVTDVLDTNLDTSTLQLLTAQCSVRSDDSNSQMEPSGYKSTAKGHG